MIVLDASVVFKWFQEEEGSERALKFEDSHIKGEENVIAPDLLFYEITNILRYQKGITPEIVDDTLGILEKIEIQTFVFSPSELKGVYRFAHVHEISVYDAMYAVLAQRLECTFVTADKKLHQKLSSCRWVRLL